MTLLFKYHFGDFAFSVFCNLFASFVLIIILLTLFTPKIIISPFIIGQIENGIKKFKFKIINPTPFTYKDVKFSLHLLRRFPDSEHNLRTKIEALKLTVESIPPLKLTVESIPVFPGRRLPF